MRSLSRKLRPVKLRLSFFYWMAGVVLFIALSLWVASWGVRVSQDWATLQQAPKVEPKTKFDASLDVAKAIVGGIGTIATIAAGVVLYLNFRVASKNTTLTESRLITERFSKAVEQLGSDKIEVRLGGIYALERIAYDSDRDHWTIMEVLTSFVQEKSPIEKLSEGQIRTKAYEIWQQSNGSGTDQECWALAIRVLEWKPVTKDIQAALTVIGRRQKKDPEDKNIAITNAKLQGADLINVNLQRAFLTCADLREAYLTNANLQGAYLIDADLQEASLAGADLQGASFQWAHLRGASLFNANLTNADLREAYLTNADLRWANLLDANLSDAVLLAADIRNAKNFNPTQLGGEKPPLLCNVALPEGFPDKDKLKDRDCDRLSQELLKRDPGRFESLEAAKELVDTLRQKKWE